MARNRYLDWFVLILVGNWNRRDFKEREFVFWFDGHIFGKESSVLN